MTPVILSSEEPEFFVTVVWYRMSWNGRNILQTKPLLPLLAHLSTASTVALNAYSYTPGPVDYVYMGWLLDQTAKIIQIRYPGWPPPWKSIFCFFSWTKRPIDSKLGRKHRMTYRLKIAKIFPIGNPRWQSWKPIFRFFSWTERPIDLKLCRKHRVTCRSEIAKIVPIGNSRRLLWRLSW